MATLRSLDEVKQELFGGGSQDTSGGPQSGGPMVLGGQAGPQQDSRPRLTKEPKKKGFLSRFASHAWEAAKGSVEAIGERAEDVKEAIGRTARGEQNPLDFGVQVVGAAAGAVGDVIGEAVMFGGKEIYDTSAATRSLWEEGGTADVIERDKAQFARAGQALLNTEMGQQAMEAISQGVDYWNEFKKNKPTFAANLEALYNIGDLATMLVGGAGAEKGLMAAGDLAMEGVERSGIKAAGEAVTEGVTGAARKIGGAFGEAGQALGPAGGALGDTGIGAYVKKAGGSLKEGAERVLKRGSEGLEEAKRFKTFSPAKQDALRSNLSEEMVDVVEGLSPETKGKINKMIDYAEEHKAKRYDPDAPQAKTVVAEELAKPADHVISARKEAGQQLKTIKNDLKGKRVNLTEARQEFINNIEETLGVIVKSDGVTIRGGRIDPTDKKVIEEMLRELRPKSGAETIRNGDWVDQLRGKLWDKTSPNKLSKDPFSGPLQNIIENTRGSLGRQLDAQIAPGYMQASEEYAKNTRVLEELVKLTGYKGKLDDFSEKGLRSLGEKAMRTLGNASAQSTEVIDNLLARADELGFDTTELKALIRASDDVEKLTGTVPVRSHAGSTQAGMEMAIGAAPTGAVTGAKSGGPWGALAGAYQKASGVTSEDQIRALRGLLSGTVDEGAGVATKEAVQEGAEAVAKQVDEVMQATGIENPEKAASLIEEAKATGSIEEFVKDQPNKAELEAVWRTVNEQK